MLKSRNSPLLWLCVHTGKGFERILESVDDMKVDVPKVDKLLPKFLAR